MAGLKPISGGGSGSGDMLKATYDPTSVNDDAFDLDNIVAGSTNVHLTTTLKSNYDNAYSHKSNNGSDHSYINQSVTSTATPAFNSLTLNNSPSASTDAARKDYVDSLIQGLDWQGSVLDYTDTPPVSPTTGDRYLVKATAGGAWAGQENKIAVYGASSWSFISPTEGFATWVEDENLQYTYNGTNWVTFGSTTSHNATSGLQGGTSAEYYHLTSAQHTVVNQAASGSQNGYLSSGDWTTFNGKLSAEADTLASVTGRGATTSTDSSFWGNISLGRNGATGALEGVLTLCDGANPGSTKTISYTKWADLEGTNGLVKCDGSGNYSAVTDSSANWGTAYTHSQLTTGNPHSVTKSDVGLGSVENTALSTWAGTANITTLGTVTTGTLSTGAVIGGVTMTLGSDAGLDTYYRSAAGVLTRLAVGTALQVPRVNAAANGFEYYTPTGGSSGGLYGINTETLSGARTLTANTDYIYQYLNPDGANRNVTLTNTGANAGDRFVIRNTQTYDNASYLAIIDGSSHTFDYIYAGSQRSYIYNGSAWIGLDSLSGSYSDNTYKNLAIGMQSKVKQGGTAVGYLANATAEYPVAIGYTAVAGTNYSVAIGDNSSCGTTGFSQCIALGSSAAASANYAIAIGRSSLSNAANAIAFGYSASVNGKAYAIAFGDSSKCERYGELVRCTDGAASNKYSYGDLTWHTATTNDTITEVYLRNTASNRATIIASSALAFNMQCVAYNSTNNKGATWTIKGGIRRDASNNTTLIGSVSSTQDSYDAKTSSDTGTFESATDTTATDSDKSWTPDAFIGKLVKITGGTGIGQKRVITDNDATSITVATWTVNPSSDSTYEIYDIDPTSWTITVTADDTNEALKVQVTGEPATIRWQIIGRFAEVRF